jgi:pimeloyl-ACP methyl ester carboxylesterase
MELLRGLAAMMPQDEAAEPPQGPPQNLREYDPEWGRAFVSGSAAASCDHAAMLTRVRVPVLFTHHFRTVDEQTGRLVGASSDLQANRVREIVTATGNRIDYRSFPDMPHSMHEHDPKLFTETVVDWVATLGRAGG